MRVVEKEWKALWDLGERKSERKTIAQLTACIFFPFSGQDSISNLAVCHHLETLDYSVNVPLLSDGRKSLKETQQPKAGLSAELRNEVRTI